MGEIFDKLRIQCRMQIFEKMSQSALNQVLTLPDYRTQKMLQIPLKIIDLQNDSNIFVTKQWKIRISVPMSYIRFWESQKVVPQGPFGRIKLYFGLQMRPAGAFWADKIVFRTGKVSRRGLLISFGQTKANPSPLLQSPGILQGGDPGTT